jgi:Surfeit locus protein 6
MVEIEMLDDDEPTMDSAKYFPKQLDPDRIKLLRKLEQSLPQDLAKNIAYFDDLVDMIPMLSLAQNSANDDEMETGKQKGPSKKYHKTGADPLTNNTKEGRKIANKLSKRRKLNATTNDDEPSNSATDPIILKNDNQGIRPLSLTPANPTIPVTPPSSTAKADGPTSSSNLSRIEALRIKLQNAIAAKQQRGASNSEQVSKRAARRAEKNRRKAMNSVAKSNATSHPSAATIYTVGTGTANTTAANPQNPAADMQNIDFGRITGLDYFAATATSKETKDILQKMSTKKNLHRLLEDAERKKQQLEELKNSSDPKDKEKAQSIQWSETFKEADGVRLKNDPSKIKKALKRKEAKKKKSQKAWKSRTEQVHSKQLERQQIRQHNVTARKQGGAAGANLSKTKIKDSTTDTSDRSRRSRPGFEGRRNEFLNSPKPSNDGKKHGALSASKK